MKWVFDFLLSYHFVVRSLSPRSFPSSISFRCSIAFSSIFSFLHIIVRSSQSHYQIAIISSIVHSSIYPNEDGEESPFLSSSRRSYYRIAGYLSLSFIPSFTDRKLIILSPFIVSQVSHSVCPWRARRFAKDGVLFSCNRADSHCSSFRSSGSELASFSLGCTGLRRKWVLLKWCVSFTPMLCVGTFLMLTMINF